MIEAIFLAVIKYSPLSPFPLLFSPTSFQRKLPLLKTPEETTWLYHELGRCRMELQDYPTARDLGEKSLTAAREAQDQMWQLNASVLVAQAESKLTQHRRMA